MTKEKKDAPTATETPLNPNSTTGNCNTLCKKSQVKKEQRTRNFATVVYPESAPSDWIDKLDQLHVAALISPLHNKDTNPSGEPKKPHYHVLLMFEGVKDYETQVKPIFAEIGGVGREMVNSARGYARYLCHLDNPEKPNMSLQKCVVWAVRTIPTLRTYRQTLGRCLRRLWGTYKKTRFFFC